MDGVHDLGGMHGFGPVEREENEPPFHAPWEATVVAIMRAARAAGLYNIDEFRHGIERMDPAHYLGSSYFEHWLDGIARILAEKGVVTAGEMEARMAFFGARPDAPASAAVTATPSAPAPRGRPESETSFRAATGAAPLRGGRGGGDAQHPPVGPHPAARATRAASAAWLPRTGAATCSPTRMPTASASSPSTSTACGSTRRELWGEAAEPNQHVYLDLWESYLLPG